MRFFENLRLRRKLLVAMVPLALMVIVAGVYSSIESKMIDTWYTSLIGQQVKALREVTEARAHTNRYGLFLYELIVETDPGRKRIVDGELQGVVSDFHGVIAEALKESPERADKINAAADLFDRAVADAQPARAAALAGNSEMATSMMLGGVNQELQQARQATINIMADLQSYVDQRSDELTRR